jgi:hypothetical protein
MARAAGAKGKLRIGDDWNAIRIIALSQSNPLKAIAELVENSIDAHTAGPIILAIADDPVSWHNWSNTLYYTGEMLSSTTITTILEPATGMISSGAFPASSLTPSPDR